MDRTLLNKHTKLAQKIAKKIFMCYHVITFWELVIFNHTLQNAICIYGTSVAICWSIVWPGLVHARNIENTCEMSVSVLQNSVRWEFVVGRTNEWNSSTYNSTQYSHWMTAVNISYLTPSAQLPTKILSLSGLTSVKLEYLLWIRQVEHQQNRIFIVQMPS